jgi:hypothetical protein
MDTAAPTFNAILEKIASLFRPREVDAGDPQQFSTYIPYRGWDDDTNLALLGNQVGFCLELAPQSGSDQSMSDILQGLMHNWPVGTGIQFHLFGTPHIKRRLPPGPGAVARSPRRRPRCPAARAPGPGKRPA